MGRQFAQWLERPPDNRIVKSFLTPPVGRAEGGPKPGARGEPAGGKMSSRPSAALGGRITSPGVSGSKLPANMW